MQLLHLDQDLAEAKDLASAEPDRAAAMRKIMTNYLNSIHAQLPVPNPDYKQADKLSNSAAGKKKGKKGAQNN